MARNIGKAEKIEFLDTKKGVIFKGDFLNVVRTLVEMT